MQTPDNRSYEAVVKKLQKIYQQRDQNEITINLNTDDLIQLAQEPNVQSGAIQIVDSGNFGIKPIASTTMTATDDTQVLPIDVNYTWSYNFNIKEQYLAFLGFEYYFVAQAPNQLVPGWVGQVEQWTPNIYKVIADGTTVWEGPNPPATYCSRLTLGQCQDNAVYYAPAWTITLPIGSNPYNNAVKQTYNFLGYFIQTPYTILHPNTEGTYYVYDMFFGFNVINCDGSGNITGTGALCHGVGQTVLQQLEGQLYGVTAPAPPAQTISSPSLPQFTQGGTWPQPWINPNNLDFTFPGIPAIPGEVYQYTSGRYDGDAIYQPASDLEFITPGSLFVGVTFEASFPTIAQFVAAGMSEAEATTAYSVIYDSWGNDLGGGTITNAFNGADWGAVRTPGDMAITGISSDGQKIAFNLMWQHYLAGGSPSWLYIGNVNNYTGGSNVFPTFTWTYGVTATYNIKDISAIFTAPVTNGAGSEGVLGTISDFSGLYASFSTTYPNYANWTFAQNGYIAYYDSTLTCPFFILNPSSNPNIGRPDQHESLNPTYVQPQANLGILSPMAVAWYYFPYRNVELLVNPPGYPKSQTVNTAMLDNTYDPFFIRTSKSTDDNESWQVMFYYSAIMLAPATFQKNLTYNIWDDTTAFQYTQNSAGYIINAQEGLAPWTIEDEYHNPSFEDGAPVPFPDPEGTQLYVASTPDTTNHSTTQVKQYGPDTSDITSRVKVSLRSPVNWDKINKYDVQVL